MEYFIIFLHQNSYGMSRKKKNAASAFAGR